MNKYELKSKWRKRKLQLMKERREYITDHGHNWAISIMKEFEKDLDALDMEDVQ